MRTALAALAILVSASGAQAAMKVSVDWGPTSKCFDPNSPSITVSGVPQGTVRLDIRMVDADAPSYPHGGGVVAYTGQNTLPYGAFTYRGPCPPSPHNYEFTVKALDSAGKALATATARKRFPPQ